MIQNDNFYLAEAFNRLSLLNEDAFDLSADKGVVDELQSFVADDIEAPAEEEVIDLAADNEDELQDSYVGKVILQCECCHAKIYKEPNEVILDETGELANVDEECPVCNCLQGWKVIGKIEPYEEPEEEKPEEEEAEVEAEFSDEEIGEALREAINEGKDCENCDEKKCEEECDKELEEKCDESLDDEYILDSDVISYEDNNGKERRKSYTKINKNIPFSQVYDWGSNVESKFGNKLRGLKGNDPIGLAIDESLTEEVEPQIKEETSVEDDQKLEDSEQEPIKEELEEVQSEDAEKLVDPEENPVLDESLNEDVRNISVDVDGTTHVEIEPQDDGGIEVKVDPEGGIEEAPVEDTMIAPLDDEDVAAIEGNNGEVPEEEPVEDEFEIDDFDEESFDELGESFLKRVYDNVSSFNTTKVNQNKNQLVVEGLIKFNSGKEKTTSFVFENYKNTKRGKVMVEGMNETFSKSNKAFLLKGTLKDKKYTCESLTYNYTASQLNESNKSETVHVYGRAVKR